MSVRCGIDDDAVEFGLSGLDGINQSTFVIGLFKAELKSILCCFIMNIGVDVIQCIVAVNFRLTFSEQV